MKALNLANKVATGRYWVSAASLSCPSVIRWCNQKDNPLVENFVPWAKGEPTKDSRKSCVSMNFDAKTSTMIFQKDYCRELRDYLCQTPIDIK